MKKTDENQNPLHREYSLWILLVDDDFRYSQATYITIQ